VNRNEPGDVIIQVGRASHDNVLGGDNVVQRLGGDVRQPIVRGFVLFKAVNGQRVRGHFFVCTADNSKLWSLPKL